MPDAIMELEQSSELEARVGHRLRTLRKKHKLSVTELAARANVSVGMISQIERSLTNPSIRTLERIRMALSVPLAALLEDGPEERDVPDNSELVRRRKDRPFFHVGEQGMTKELLSPRGNHDLQMMLITLPAGANSKDVLIGEGEKVGLVLSGTVVLDVAGRRAEVAEGDSFQFSSTLSHGLYNDSREDARILWIMNTKPTVTHF